MTLESVLIMLLIAAVCGSLGQALVGYSVGGCLVSIVVGLIGAWVGMYVATQLGLPEPFLIEVGDTVLPVLWSILGSALFAVILGLANRLIRGPVERDL